VKTTLINFAKFFVTNFKTIIFAFVLSLIIWFAVSFQLFPDVPRTITAVPVSADVSEDMRVLNLELSETFSENIDISILGKRFEIGGLSAGDFYARLDFSEIRTAGEHTVPVIIGKHGTEAEFSIMSEGLTRTVRVIEVAEMSIILIPDVDGVETIPGMTTDSDEARVNPATVVIRGERSLISSIRTGHVVVNSEQPLSASADLQGELVLYGRDEQIIDIDRFSMETRAFMVSVPVFMTKNLPLEVDLINTPENFDAASLRTRMVFEPSEVEIASPDNSIENLDSLSLGTISLGSITFSDLEQGIVIPLTLPTGYRNMSGYHTVLLEFDDVGDYGVITLNVPAANISVINVPTGYSVSLRTRQVPVSIIGPSEVIQAMTIADIAGTINLAGIADITAGTRFAGGTFTIAGAEVNAWVVGSYNVEVAVSRRN